MMLTTMTMTEKDIYQEHGFKDRNSYLNSLADDYGMDIYAVSSIAEILGENEDFDGLVTAMEDFSIFY